MPELDLCTKCHAEPRVPGQRWGLNCRAKAEAARRARVPHETRGTVPRRERSQKVDEWLLAYSKDLLLLRVNAVVAQMREAGLFSKKTSALDIRSSVRMRCAKLNLAYRE